MRNYPAYTFECLLRLWVIIKDIDTLTLHAMFRRLYTCYDYTRLVHPSIDRNESVLIRPKIILQVDWRVNESPPIHCPSSNLILLVQLLGPLFGPVKNNYAAAHCSLSFMLILGDIYIS